MIFIVELNLNLQIWLLLLKVKYLCTTLSMAFYNKTLKLIATKLGLVEDEKVLNKAAEFERLLHTKMTAGNVLTDTSKTIVCLDLAAVFYGADLDRKSAIKFSGLKGPTYNNCRKVVENLLELNSDKLTIQFLCLTLNCTDVQLSAQEILEEYQQQAKREIDLNLPQYICMAVHQASRINKVKLSKGKLIEKSRLKPSQWTKMDADWTKFVDEKFAVFKTKRSRLPKNANKNDETEKMEVNSPEKEKPSEPQIEPYEEWKRRMLETAYKELRELEKKEKVEYKEKDTLNDKQFMSPRRSPRKTPQKFTPYRSPRTPGTGIRLLFPKEL